MRKFALVSMVAALTALSSGCSVLPKVKKIWGKPFNVAGAIERFPSSDRPWKSLNTFNATPAGTLHTSTEEIWFRRNFSGSETKLLWGLFTITDY